MQSKLTPGSYMSWRDALIAELNISSDTYKQRFLKGLSQVLQERFTKSTLGKLEKPGLITRSTLELLFYFNRNTQRSFPQEHRITYLLNELDLSPQTLWDKYATSLPLNMAKENLQRNEYFRRQKKLTELQPKLSSLKSASSMCGAIIGMGGAGKTYLAAGIGLESWIIDLFPDGVLWIQLNCDHKNYESSCDGQNINLQLDASISALENQLHGKKKTALQTKASMEKFAQLIGQQNILIIIDDVWEWETVNQLQTTLQEYKCKNCKILLTTRLRLVANQLEINAEHQLEMGQMDPRETVELLQSGINQVIPEQARKHLVYLSSGSPLAIDLVKNQLKLKLCYHEMHFDNTAEAMKPICETLIHQLQECGPSALHNHGKEARHSSLGRCFNSSLAYLKLIDDDTPLGTVSRVERFNSLCAFKKGTAIPFSFLAKYWGEPIGIVMAICEDFYDLTLISNISKNQDGELCISTYDVFQCYLIDKNKLENRYHFYHRRKASICRQKENKPSLFYDFNDLNWEDLFTPELQTS